MAMPRATTSTPIGVDASRRFAAAVPQFVFGTWKATYPAGPQFVLLKSGRYGANRSVTDPIGSTAAATIIRTPRLMSR